MEELKPRSESICQIPPEIWASISKGIPGEQLGRLKLTGSKILWRQISSPRAVTSIKLGTDLLTFKKWPRFLDELSSIENISILCKNIEWWSSWAPKLDSVPRRLRKLKIHSDVETTSSFFLRGDGTPFSLLELVPLLDTLDLNLDWSHQYPWLAYTPPNLTDLKVQTWETSLPLPSTLLHFRCTSMSRKDNSTPFILPPMLISLIMADPVCSRSLPLEWVAPYLPKSLRTFHIQLSKIDAKDINLLPSGVETLILTKSMSGPGDQPTKMFNAPAALTSLTISQLPAELWGCLPNTLKKLNLNFVERTCAIVRRSVTGSDGTVHNFSTLPIHALPKSITQLSVQVLVILQNYLYIDADPSQSTESELFPPKLTFLRVRDAQLSEEAAKQLPASLTELSLSHLHSGIAKHLPHGLKRLYAGDVLMSPELIQSLPKTLHWLSMQFAPIKYSWIDPSIAKKRYTVDLVAKGWQHSDTSPLLWNGDYCLPPSLKYCYLGNFESVGESFVSQNLHSMVYLTLDSIHFSNNAIPLLPRTITHLSLKNSSKITGKCFSDLPPSLEVLALIASKDVANEDIVQLPRSLIALYLCNALKLTDLCIKDLPKGIEKLALDKSQISKAALPELPSMLRSLALGSTFRTAEWKLEFGKIVDRGFFHNPGTMLFQDKFISHLYF